MGSKLTKRQRQLTGQLALDSVEYEWTVYREPQSSSMKGWLCLTSTALPDKPPISGARSWRLHQSRWNHGWQAAAPNRSSSEDCFERDLSDSHTLSCDQFLFRVRNKRRIRSKFWRVTSVARPESAFLGDFHAMIKYTALILSAATLSFRLALAPAAFIDANA
jgi:hypothetical protein